MTLNRTDYVRTVLAAQQGDAQAFGRLVAQFHDVAMAIAFGWLGDVERARDVSQEAFLETYLRLAQLRDAEAFPAWFRQIVRKHCDRITRKKQLRLEDLEQAASRAGDGRDPEGHAIAGQEARKIRLSVESLTPHERTAVALTYFADLSGNEIADFLDVPLSTVKKRLHDAKARLRSHGDDLMEKTLMAMRPAQNQGFAEEVTFFIALRAGDPSRVKAMLEQNPSLAHAQQNWDRELMYRGVLPLANKATALITAIELGDLPMQSLLLDAGADANGLCGCVTEETPVWTATLFNRPAHLKDLLRRGADPNRRSAAGNMPLHLAAMRGYEDIAQVLLAHGADPAAHDADTRGMFVWTGDVKARSPADWARLNGHSRLAALIEAHGGNGAQHDPDAPAATPEAETQEQEIMETGIRVLDLFGLVPRNGLVRVPLMSGVGVAVLLGEISCRYIRRPPGAVIWTGFCQPPFDRKDWAAEIAELGLADKVALRAEGYEADDAERRIAFDTGIREAIQLRDQGKEVLVVIFRADGFDSDVEATLPLLRGRVGTGSLTTIVVSARVDDAQEQRMKREAPFSAQIIAERERARARLWPAVSPVLSNSGLLSSRTMTYRHFALAERALSILDSYEAGDPGLKALAAMPESELEEARNPAIRLMRYLRQPFFVAEPFTGRPGEFTTRAVLLDEVEAILKGTS